MVTGRLLENARAVFDAAAFGVISAEIEPPDAGEADGGGAHGARFECDVEVAIGQARRLQYVASRTNNQQFGMGGGVRSLDDAVAGLGDDFAVVHDESADGDFAARGG